MVADNPYPGRGVVMGCAEDKQLLQLYWIMGRSENSRNRIFEAEGAMLRTRPADPSKLQDPSLVIYEAMLEFGDHYIVSNGDQTRTVFQSLKGGGTFESALLCRDREPDAPNYTPRITGMISLVGSQVFYRYSILKANASDPSVSDRNFYYKEEVGRGLGFGITTYKGDGQPLPSFEGEPMALPMVGSPQEILESYWNALDADNKISLALKTIDPLTGKAEIFVVNRYA